MEVYFRSHYTRPDERRSPTIATILWGILIILLSVLLAVIGQALVHRHLVPLPLRKSHNTPIGTVYAALYVLYGVTLGFSLFLVRQDYSDAQRTANREASDVEGLYRLAKQFPEPQRDQIQGLTQSYARVVVDEEWPLLGQGQASQESSRAEQLADALLENVNGYDPSTSAEQARYTQALTLSHDLQSDRGLRLLQSRRGLPTMLWVILVVGGLLTIGFTFLLGMDAPWLHRTSIAGLTVIVVLILYTLYHVQYPFTGDTGVGPVALENVLQEIEEDSNS
jgi:hypothetical protein